MRCQLLSLANKRLLMPRFVIALPPFRHTTGAVVVLFGVAVIMYWPRAG
jgi:hypothetical protein